MILEINDASDIPVKLSDQLVDSIGDLPSPDGGLGAGVLLAKRGRKNLRIEDGAALENQVPESFTGHLVICENRQDIVPIVAANYAYALGAALLLIPDPPAGLRDEINESLYSLYEPHPSEPMETRLERIKGRIRGLLAGYDPFRYSGITFITSGIPYGLAVPEVPTTHLFAYPHLGNTIASAIGTGGARHPDARVALLIEPGELRGSETEFIAEILGRRGIFTRVLTADAAKVYSVARHIELFPYDLLVVSTHATEVSGRRITASYKDREGVERTLVYDLGAGFAPIPGTDQVEVSEFHRFVSLDGVPWEDVISEGSPFGKATIGEAVTRRHEELTLIHAADVRRVPGAMALKMFDSNYIPHPYVVADHNDPIIINNACASWNQMALWMTGAGAKAYVGTLFNVTAAEARAVVEAYFTRHFDEPLAFALWQVQREVYGPGRRPYIVVGPHFIGLRETRLHAVRYLARRLGWGLRRWEAKAAAAQEEDVRRNSVRAVEFLREQLDTFVRKWGSHL